MVSSSGLFEFLTLLEYRGMLIRSLVAVCGLSICSSAFAQSWDMAAELRADASLRTSALAAAGGGWERGNFYLTDGGANSLKIYGQSQVRYLLNLRDDAVGDPADFTNGFQLRRTRVGAKGTIWSKDFSYNIYGDFSRSNGDFTLLDATGQYKFGDGMNVQWGQFKLPFLREELVSSGKQTAVERSTVNSVFSLVRSQGVQVSMERETFRGSVMISDGRLAANTDFTSAAEADYALTARGEFRFGEDDFKRFDDLSSFRGSKFAGLVGAAVHYQDGGETNATAATEVLTATIDGAVEGDGWNVFAAAVWRNTEVGGGETDDFGVVIQGGYFITDQFEAFARYDGVFADDDAGGDDFNTGTLGVNYYISPESHAVKASADVQYYFDDQAGSGIVTPATSTNLLADGEDGQIALRLQMQVLF